MSEHIIIGSDRYVTVPESLQKIGVQFDHNAETVTFDCPRYWDEHDLSKMQIYVNYMRPNDSFGTHICTNVMVDSSDNTIIHFDWTVSGHVTEFAGPLSFLVCMRSTDDDGDITAHWNSELNSQLYISSGMKCRDAILGRYPDIITQLLQRMEVVENVSDGVAANAANAAESEAKAAEYAEIAKKNSEGMEEYAIQASTSAANAKISETNAAASAVAAENSLNAIGDSVAKAAESADNAKASEETVNSSASAAALSETNAKASETNAAKSASTALTSEANATSAANSAKTSADAATNAEINAKNSEISASSSAVSASVSEANAGISAEEASASAATAAISEVNASNSELMARSWAVGGTGLREDEAVNNAQYWSSLAKDIAGGDFATVEEAQGYATIAKSEAVTEANEYTDTADIDCGTW